MLTNLKRYFKIRPLFSLILISTFLLESCSPVKTGNKKELSVSIVKTYYSQEILQLMFTADSINSAGNSSKSESGSSGDLIDTSNLSLIEKIRLKDKNESEKDKAVDLHPLFNFFHPNIYTDENHQDFYVLSSIVGYALTADTEKVNVFMRQPVINEINNIPLNLTWVKADTNYFYLYGHENTAPIIDLGWQDIMQINLDKTKTDELLKVARALTGYTKYKLSIELTKLSFKKINDLFSKDDCLLISIRLGNSNYYFSAIKSGFKSSFVIADEITESQADSIEDDFFELVKRE